MSALEEYSARVRGLFAAPPNAGPLPPGAGTCCVGEAEALDRGAWIRLEARVHGGIVVAARFRAWGSPHVIAAASLAAARLEGQPAASLSLPGAEELLAALEAPADRLGRLLVVEDALQALAADLGRNR